MQKCYETLGASYSIAGHHQCLFTYFEDRSEPDTNVAAVMQPFTVSTVASWWRGTVVERRSLAGELSLSCARPAADG